MRERETERDSRCSLEDIVDIHGMVLKETLATGRHPAGLAPEGQLYVVLWTRLNLFQRRSVTRSSRRRPRDNETVVRDNETVVRILLRLFKEKGVANNYVGSFIPPEKKKKKKKGTIEPMKTNECICSLWCIINKYFSNLCALS